MVVGTAVLVPEMLTVDHDQQAGVDAAEGESGVGDNGLGNLLAAHPDGHGVCGMRDEEQEAKLDGRRNELADRGGLNADEMVGEDGLESGFQTESLHDLDVGQAFGGERARVGHSAVDLLGVLFGKVLAHVHHCVIGGHEHEENKGEAGIHDEGDDICGDEV